MFRKQHRPRKSAAGGSSQEVPDYWCERVDCVPPIAVDVVELAGVGSAEPTAFPPFDPGVEICACVSAPAPVLGAGVDGGANAPPTALPPFDPGVEICAAEGDAFAPAPVPGPGDVNAPPTALPPFDPGVEICACAQAAGATAISAAAIRNGLVMTYLQRTRMVAMGKFQRTASLAQSHLRKQRRQGLTRACFAVGAKLPTKGGQPVAQAHAWFGSRYLQCGSARCRSGRPQAPQRRRRASTRCCSPHLAWSHHGAEVHPHLAQSCIRGNAR